MKPAPFRKLTPVPFHQVSVSDSFWSPRMETNRRVTLPAEYSQMAKTGHLTAWEWKPGQPKEPHIYWDSDIAKWIEAAAYSLRTNPNRKLEAQVDELIDRMARTQAPDGYLNSHFQRVEPDKRWTNLRDWHELYCAGHLIEAAVAYFEATGKRKFLEVMCRYADYINRTFGRKKGQIKGYCGHPEIELALVRLARVTGEKRYLELSYYFVTERGQKPNFFVQEQHRLGKKIANLWNLVADIPMRRQSHATGHAVRAGYLYSAMADLAAEKGDKSLLAACRRIWDSITKRRMYIIGGIGSTRFHEQFTFDYDLPNEEAYAETCANISLVFFAHRLLQIDPDRQYSDVIERALYNGILSGVSLDGTHFFYDNRLAVKPGYAEFNNQKPSVRQKWFGCACCPPNISRTLASLGGYVYSQTDQGIWTHLFINGKADFELGAGKVTIEQETRYPWEGKIAMKVNPEKPSVFTLAARIPGWCRKATVKLNGKIISQKTLLQKGYLTLRREWRQGDILTLLLDMPVERIEAHPSVRHNAGRAALQRGPLVYCLEEIDNGRDLADIHLPDNAKLTGRFEPKLLGGVVAVTGKAERRSKSGWEEHLYRPVETGRVSVPFRAVPYAFWANRKPGEMVVWILR